MNFGAESPKIRHLKGVKSEIKRNLFIGNYEKRNFQTKKRKKKEKKRLTNRKQCDIIKTLKREKKEKNKEVKNIKKRRK